MQRLLLVSLLCTCFSCFAQEPVDNRQRTIVIENVNLVTMDGSGTLLENQKVVVSNGRHLIGNRVHAEITSILPSAGGKMVFARIPGEAGDELGRSRLPF